MKVDIGGNAFLSKIFEAGLKSVDAKSFHIRSIARMIDRGRLKNGADIIASLEGLTLEEIATLHDELVDSHDRQSLLDAWLKGIRMIENRPE